MGTQQVGLTDVSRGQRPSGARLLAPLRYLFIQHPEKTTYDFKYPSLLTAILWTGYMVMNPKPAVFGQEGLLQFSRDLLVMSVPFMIGALATVAMGYPGSHLDRRPVGAELYLGGELLTLRQFVCFLLGYLSFIGMLMLCGVVTAIIMKGPVLEWTKDVADMRVYIKSVGMAFFFMMLSILSITVLWALYFLTTIVNDTRGNKSPHS